MRALIVDDEPTVRLLLSRLLRRDVDCAVTEATNGLTALDLLARHQYDFVLMDVMMPIMDGLETLEAIRRTPALRTLPVMILSAVREEAQVRRLVALGISAYLTKPLRPSDASARIQRFVASIGAGRDASRQAQGRTLLGLPDGARLLVVDGDADFRRFVRSTLGHQYAITEAEGGAQGLRSCLADTPAAILLGQELGAVPATMFLRKLRGLPGLAAVPVVLADARADGDPPAPDADALIARTFVPEAFKQQFARLVTGGSADQRVLLTRPELRPQMISATEQVFGMMLGLEVFAAAAEPTPPKAGEDLAVVLLSLPAEDSDLEFGIAAARAMGERMTAFFLRGAEVVTGEDVASTLQEVANIISGRLQNALRALDDEVRLSLPVVSTLSENLSIADTWAGVGFHDTAGDVRFTTFLRPVPRTGALLPPSGATWNA